MQETDYVIQQDKKPQKKYNLKLLLFAIGILAAIILVCVSIWGHQNSMAFSLITLDANPGFEITVNQKEEVIKVVGVNEDAQKILEGRNYKGWRLEDTVLTLCDGLLENDYLNATSNIILISVSSSGDTTEILTRISDDVTKLLPQHYRIIGLENTEDKEIQNEATRHSITQGKMHLISILADSLPDYSYTDLAAMSLVELLDLIRNENIDTGIEAIAEIISETGANDASTEIAALLARMNETYYRLAELYASSNYESNAQEIGELQAELLDIYVELAGYSYFDYDIPQPGATIPSTSFPNAPGGSDYNKNADAPAEIATLLTRMNAIYSRLAELYASSNAQGNAQEISELQAELLDIYEKLAGYSYFDDDMPQPEVIVPSMPFSTAPNYDETGNTTTVSNNKALFEQIDEIHNQLAILYTNENYYENMQEVHDLQTELSMLYAELGYEYGSYYSDFNP